MVLRRSVSLYPLRILCAANQKNAPRIDQRRKRAHSIENVLPAARYGSRSESKRMKIELTTPPAAVTMPPGARYAAIWLDFWSRIRSTPRQTKRYPIAKQLEERLTIGRIAPRPSRTPAQPRPPTKSTDFPGAPVLGCMALKRGEMIRARLMANNMRVADKKMLFQHVIFPRIATIRTVRLSQVAWNAA